MVVKRDLFHMEACPICGGKLCDYDLDARVCNNRCFDISSHFFAEHDWYLFIKIFNHTVLDSDAGQSRDDVKKFEKRVTEAIEYWKENDRYLVRILNGGE